MFGYLWGHGLRENDRAIVRCKVSRGIERTGDGEYERVDYQKPDFIFRRPMHLGLNVLSSIFPTAAFVRTGGHERCRKCAARLSESITPIGARFGTAKEQRSNSAAADDRRNLGMK
jgi:hypothetical protein